MGWFRPGFIANFLSYPVISGFITASGVTVLGAFIAKCEEFSPLVARKTHTTEMFL